MIHTVHIPMYIFVVTLHLSCHLQCSMYVCTSFVVSFCLYLTVF